jgi:GntR family transcriptional regulator/MocR family aminotransferase
MVGAMVRHATSLFSVDVIDPRAAGQPAYARVEARIRAAIASGALPINARLPSSRTLAKDFGVARNTVEEALAQLVADGLVVRQRGVGSFVCASPPADPPPRRVAEGQATAPRLSNRARALAAYPGHPSASDATPFTPSLPPADLFPRRIWLQLMRREAAQPGAAYWNYGASSGLPALRQAIAAHAAAMRGAHAAADQVIVTTSAQQAADLAAKVLADPGDGAWVERPGYQPAEYVLRSAGLTIAAAPVDQEGLDVEAAIRLQPRARLVYVTPSHQYPLGHEMSLVRRQALIDWARATDAYIIEDDYDGDYRYEGRPIAALQAMAPDRVIYVGSFNKILFPGLRLAYALVPPALAGAFADAKHAADGHTALLAQGVLAAFIGEGHLARHLRATHAIYNARRLAFLEAARILEPDLALGPARAGMHVTGVFRDPAIDDRAVAAACARGGIVVSPLSKHGGAGRGGLVFGFASAPTERIGAGLEVVRRSILAVQGAAGSGSLPSARPGAPAASR